MDELTRAAAALRKRAELAPTPLPAIEQRMKQRRRRHRVVGVGTALVVAIVAIVGIASASTRSASKPDHVFVGEPSTVVAPSTVAPSTTTTTNRPTAQSTEVLTKPAQRSNTTPPYFPPISNYTTGHYAITNYDLSNPPTNYEGPVSVTVTKDAVWYSNSAGIVRVDPSVGALTGRVALPNVAQITSTPNTVYVLSATPGGRFDDVTAIDAMTLATRWHTGLPAKDAPASPNDIASEAVGKGVLWVAQPVGIGGVVQSLDLATGKLTQTIDIGAPTTTLVATATNVYVGSTYASVTRVNLGPTPSITTLDLPGPFRPYAFDGGGLWGALQQGPNASDRHLVQISSGGRFLHSVAQWDSFGGYPTGFAPAGDGTAWVTEAPNIVARIDTATGRVLDSGKMESVANQGPADIHLFDGVGWATGGMVPALVRIIHH